MPSPLLDGYGGASTPSQSLLQDTATVARVALTAAVLSVAGCAFIMADTLRIHGSCRRACGCDARQRALRRRMRQLRRRHSLGRSQQPSPSRTSYGTTSFLPESESYQPRIVGSPSPPAFPESMLSSSLDSSTGSAASSGEVQHGHVASSGEYTSSTTSFVKQREFAEKSGPFLLFNLNLAVLLLSLAFMMSSGAILADRGNATLLHDSFLCLFNGAVVYYCSAASMFFVLFICVATTMYQYGQEISTARRCIGLMVGFCWALPALLLALVLLVDSDAIYGYQVYEAWCGLNTHAIRVWIEWVGLYVPLIIVLGVCIASCIATVARFRTLRQQAASTRSALCGEMQLKLFLLCVAFFVAHIGIVIDAGININDSRFAVNSSNIDTFPDAYVRALHQSAIYYACSVPGFGALLFFAYMVPTWINGRPCCTQKRDAKRRSLINSIKTQTMSFNQFHVVDDNSEAEDF